MTAGEFVYLIRADKSQLNSTLDSAEKDTKSWGSKISAWTVAKGQMIANVATKAVTKVFDMSSKLIVGAVNAAKEYEQLVGGVDTLFKDSSEKVQKYAAEAYKNVGISANEYMQNVTSFSASLLQSLGSDTDKAAEIADMAMVDMADNANKMGTAMDSIQHAYQGFAKQNYTMLDNLKLGYGGTKTEMERLLKDAEKLTKKKYDIKNLSDVYEAIHAIQEEMGIAGTTKKEAMETVEGSMNAAKAAWQDVLTAMGNGKDVKKAIKNFAGTAKTALHNYAPVLRNAVEGIVEGAKALAPELGNIINEVGRGLFGKQWDITINWIQNAWNDVNEAFDTAVKWVGNAYKVTVEWIQNAWNTVTNAFADAKAWAEDKYNAVVEWSQNAWDTVKDAFDDAKEWINKTFQTTVEWVNKAWDTVSGAFNSAVEWVDKTRKATIEWVNNAWDDVTNAFTEAGKWAEKTFPTTIKWVRESWALVSASFTAAREWAGKTFDSTIKWVQEAWDDVKDAITQVGKGVWDNVVNFSLGLTDAVTSFINRIKQPINVLVNFLKGGTTSFDEEGNMTVDYGDHHEYESADGGGGAGHSFAKGVWRVPYDMTARIHKDEQILTPSQARQNGNNGNADYEVIAGMIGTEIKAAFDRLGVYLYGDKVGDMTSKRVNKNIRARSYAVQRAMGG